MRESMNLIFGRPDIVDGVGLVHPVTLVDYDEFQEASSFIYYSKAHFGKEYDNYPLLDLIVYGLRDDKIIGDIETVIKIVTKKNSSLYLDEKSGVYGFYIDEGSSLTNQNYEAFRSIVMKQNLMFEQKVYKDKRTQEWAQKVMAAKSKSGVRIELEDMITTIAAFSGKHYWDLEKYTIYQLQSEFKRIGKIKGYDSDIAIACVSGDGSKIGHYAEYLDLFRNPYDDLFVSKDKLTNLNKALS